MIHQKDGGQVGKTISHYKILEKLGSGGMGVVYKAEDTKLKRTVALKFLPESATGSGEQKKRFLREAQAAAALNHANIATIYEIDEVDGQIFIAMEFIEGSDLAGVIYESPLRIGDAVDFAVQIAEGLHAAHKKKIIHRDIKPANILLSEEGQVKIVDFGLAKLAGMTRLTKEGTTLGTVAYMSPEQGQGETTDHRTDIWSLGVVVYEMITGQAPFKGDYEQAVTYSIMNEDAEPVTGLRTGVPTELERIVNKAMAKRPDERYQNLGDILVDLKAMRKKFVAEKDNDAKPLGLSKPSIASKLKQRKIGVILIASFIVISSSIAIWWITRSDTQRTSPGGTEEVKSIAVLPFMNMSADKENEYFCDGMVEDLINALTKIKGLLVTARTSAFAFKGKNVDIRKIGRELNVGTVLDGSVRKMGSHLRITVQLINVSDGYHIWTEQYNREMDDIFAIQDEITLAIVEKLKVKFFSGEKAKLVKHYTENLEAYNLYLMGRYYWNKRTAEGFQKGIAYFQQAIDKDPTYALAYAGIADCYNLLGWHDLLPSNEVYPKAKAAAEKALMMDETISEAHASLAYVRMLYDWDWLAAEKEYKRALELNPNYAVAHQWYSEYLAYTGRHDESIAEAKRAQELDPLSLSINHNLGLIYYEARQYDLAIEEYQKTLHMGPNFIVTYNYLGLAYAGKKMYIDAVAKVQKAIDLSERQSPLFIGTLGIIYSFMGKRDEAEKVLEELLELSRHRYIAPVSIASIYAGLGQKDQAFEWIEKGYEVRDDWMMMLKVDPRLDSLRSDPRFTELLKRREFEQ
jgi:serine/threonine-protein kinase